ncbi:MAG: hypothetical protein R6U68_08275 [Desulfobacteraceae bacterium]
MKINNVGEDAVLLAFDSVRTNTLFQKGRGQNMRCDYVLISNGAAYFMELKSSRKSEIRYHDACIKKFKAVECLTGYIDGVTEAFYDTESIFFNLKRRFVLFYKAPSINIKTTSRKPADKPFHDKPEHMLCWPVGKNADEVDISFLA